MMKDEFESLIGKRVSNEEYKVIEMVYTWHPAITNKKGKEQMKVLYLEFGMSVIKGMLPIAEKMEMLEGEKRKLESQMNLLKQREKMITEGDMRLEETIETVDEMFKSAEYNEQFELMMKELDIEECIKDAARKIVGC